MNFNIEDFTVVSHTTNSFTITRAHPFFPGWVRVVAAHRTNRIRKAPCPQNPEEDLEAKKRVRRNIEPPEVQRFLRQKLLRKVGHSWWNRPRVYRHDQADERELAQPVQSVVVIPLDPDQPEASPERQEPGPSGPSDMMTPVGPVETSFSPAIQKSPRGPGRDEWRQQRWSRRWACVAAIQPIKDRPVASSWSATGPIFQRIREKHPASPPEWPKNSETRARGDQGWPGETEILQEPPLPRRKTASTPRPERGGSPTRAE